MHLQQQCTYVRMYAVQGMRVVANLTPWKMPHTRAHVQALCITWDKGESELYL